MHSRDNYSWISPGIMLAAFLLIPALLSCSSDPPKQVYAQKAQLTRFRTVLLTVRSSALEVQYATAAPMSLATGLVIATGPFLFGLLGDIAATVIEDTVRKSEDGQHTGNVKEKLGEVYLDKLLGDCFFDLLQKGNLFQVHHSGQRNDKGQPGEGYDAIIELHIEEFSLRRISVTDKLQLYLQVTGKMTDLRNNNVVWHRVEVVRSNEEFRMDEISSDGGKTLVKSIEKMLKKIAHRFSSDLLYSG